MEDCGEQNADPPAEDVDSNAPHSNAESSLLLEDAPVECENAGLDDGHGAGMENLQREHHLTLRAQFPWIRKPGRVGICTIVLIVSDACDDHPDDIVDGDSKRHDLYVSMAGPVSSRSQPHLCFKNCGFLTKAATASQSSR